MDMETAAPGILRWWNEGGEGEGEKRRASKSFNF